MRRSRFLTIAAVLGVITAASVPAAAAAKPAKAPEPAASIKHVVVIELENKGYDETFGPASPATYLNHTLRPTGQLLTQYYGIGHASLDNYIAEISGQAPNPATQGDCPVYADFTPSPAVLDGNGQAVGAGCVFPANVPTVANQLQDKGLGWKGYMEDMGNDPARDNGTACAHPPLNQQDPTEQAAVGDQYATRHNPFMYFHSIIDDGATCRAHVVPLGPPDNSALLRDFASAQTVPALAFVTPNLCHDGHDGPCVDGEPGGLTSADQFLSRYVPPLLSSAGFADGGLLIVTFDESDSSDSTACCNEQPGPNSPFPGLAPTSPSGGGRVGAVLVSSFVAPGTENVTPFNHYALLRSVEDLFGLSHLGFAAADGLQAFGDDHDDVPVYTAPSTGHHGKH